MGAESDLRDGRALPTNHLHVDRSIPNAAILLGLGLAQLTLLACLAVAAAVVFVVPIHKLH